MNMNMKNIWIAVVSILFLLLGSRLNHALRPKAKHHGPVPIEY
jgi:hypothetical protein